MPPWLSFDARSQLIADALQRFSNGVCRHVQQLRDGRWLEGPAHNATGAIAANASPGATCNPSNSEPDDWVLLKLQQMPAPEHQPCRYRRLVDHAAAAANIAPLDYEQPNRPRDKRAAWVIFLERFHDSYGRFL